MQAAARSVPREGTLTQPDFDGEIESLLDRERVALRRLGVAVFVLAVASGAGLPYAVGAGPIGWLVGGLVLVVAFAVFLGFVTDLAVAREAVARRLGRRD